MLRLSTKVLTRSSATSSRRTGRLCSPSLAATSCFTRSPRSSAAARRRLLPRPRRAAAATSRRSLTIRSRPGPRSRATWPSGRPRWPRCKQRPSASSHGHLAQRAWFGTGVRVDGGWSVRPVDAGRQWRGFDGTGWRAGRVGPGRHENNRTKVSERTNKTTNESAARPLACVRGQGGSFCVETRQTNGGGRLPGVQQNQDGKQGGASGRRPLSCVRRGGGGAAARWRRMRREPRASRVLVGMWGGKPGRCGRWGVDARVRCERDASAAPAVAAGEARPRGGRACAVLAPGWCVR
mmetsp:Transcript_26035/g.53729  ORF Transcript_26035/g.53729 Transcript_26035/m.53729 type:complete len:294 (-) Transcript_26035:42-923(-)